MSRIVAVAHVGWSRVCDRVIRLKSSNRSRRTTVRPTRSALRSRRAMRSTRPARSSSTCCGERGPRPPARCEPIDRRRRPTCTGRGSRLCARAWRWRPDAGPSIATSPASSSAAMSPTVLMPRSVQLLGGHPSDAPQPLHGQWVEEVELGARRHHEQPVRLADRAGHLGQELGARDADGDRQTDPLAHGGAQAGGDLDGLAGDASQAADVEERLVDGDALDHRRGVVEHLEHRLAGVDVGLEARLDDHRVGAQAPVPGGRPSPCAPHAAWPRSSPRARPHRRRSPVARAARVGRAARPRRRTRRDRRAGSTPSHDHPSSLARTNVRTGRSAPQGPWARDV